MEDAVGKLAIVNIESTFCGASVCLVGTNPREDDHGGRYSVHVVLRLLYKL